MEPATQTHPRVAREAEGSPDAPASAVAPKSRIFEGRGWIFVRLASDLGFATLAMLAAVYGASTTVGAAGVLPSVVFVPTIVALFALRGMYASVLQVEVLPAWRASPRSWPCR